MCEVSAGLAIASLVIGTIMSVNQEKEKRSILQKKNEIDQENFRRGMEAQHQAIARNMQNETSKQIQAREKSQQERSRIMDKVLTSKATAAAALQGNALKRVIGGIDYSGGIDLATSRKQEGAEISAFQANKINHANSLPVGTGPVGVWGSENSGLQILGAGLEAASIGYKAYENTRTGTTTPFYGYGNNASGATKTYSKNSGITGVGRSYR